MLRQQEEVPLSPLPIQPYIVTPGLESTLRTEILTDKNQLAPRDVRYIEVAHENPLFLPDDTILARIRSFRQRRTEPYDIFNGTLTDFVRTPQHKARGAQVMYSHYMCQGCSDVDTPEPNHMHRVFTQKSNPVKFPTYTAHEIVDTDKILTSIRRGIRLDDRVVKILLESQPRIHYSSTNQSVTAHVGLVTFRGTKENPKERIYRRRIDLRVRLDRIAKYNTDDPLGLR
ncbi:MAG: hypothetical protein ABIA93_05035 [Candidatus Woesearchaeota archaeon]